MNRLNRLVTAVNTTALLPAAAKPAALSLLFNSQVKMAFTCGIQIQELSAQRAQLALRNRRRVQNHIGGVHACGMALLAESASGVVFGMNVRDSCIPVIKSMSIRYTKRAQGDLQAVATLTPAQIQEINSKDKGEVLVDVQVTDATGAAPIECEMLWAWISKTRK
ncbi:hypothetical protein BBJ28_00016061 [Nothophytophthora sp. Chile5]|nr:hypothetical protein BBJ28_00016061 [Nothophytophthora sp. Chile5]